MSDENLLSDLESDIEGDWEDIQRDIKEKKQQEYLKNNPRRLHIPNVKQFYQLLFNIFSGYFVPEKAIDKLIGMFRNTFYYNERLPRSFEYVWEMFCDSTKYSIQDIYCRRCKEPYDVIFEKDRSHGFMSEYSFGDRVRYPEEMMLKTERVFCPSCGYNMLTINANIIGIVKHPYQKEKYMEERSEIIRKFRIDF